MSGEGPDAAAGVVAGADTIVGSEPSVVAGTTTTAGVASTIPARALLSSTVAVAVEATAEGAGPGLDAVALEVPAVGAAADAGPDTYDALNSANRGVKGGLKRSAESRSSSYSRPPEHSQSPAALHSIRTLTSCQSSSAHEQHIRGSVDVSFRA